MRVVFFGNNRVGCRILKWLKTEGEDIVGLVLHPPDRCKFGDEMRTVSGLGSSAIFDATELKNKQTLQSIKELGADIGVSAYFGYRISHDLFQSFPKGCINIHPSFLPFNKGAYPNVWSIIDGTPAGVTIHYIDEGFDTGDIIAQKAVTVGPTDTGASLYQKLEEGAVELFATTWPRIRVGEHGRTPQTEDEGTHHTVKDVDEIDEIDLDAKYSARELIDLMRARTFPPYRGAYFTSSGRRVYLRLELEDEGSSEGG